MPRRNGGVLGKQNRTTTIKASGLWSLSDIIESKKAENWPKTAFLVEVLIIAGGGAGGQTIGGGGGAGGLGGGGRGGNNTNSLPESGTINTGGGGGGQTYGSGNSGSGGSGVVVIRYLGIQRGTGGNVTTSNGYTIHTFNSSGTFTA